MNNLKNFSNFSINEENEPRYINFTLEGKKSIQDFLSDLSIYRKDHVRHSSHHLPEMYVFDSDEIEVKVGHFKIKEPNIDGSAYILENSDGIIIVKISFRENRPIPLPPVISAYLFLSKPLDLEQFKNKIGNWETEIWDMKKVKNKIMGGRHKL
jgi:hypothetical protein